MASYALSTGAVVAYLALGYPPGPIFLAPFWGLLDVVGRAGSWRLWIPAAVVGGAALATVHGFAGGELLESSIFLAVWLVCALVAGVIVVVRRRFAAEVAARSRWAQRSRAEEEARRLAEERLRIAREVHDVVGHSLAVISLQAGVAEHLLESRPQDVRQAVSAIRRVSRQALGELRVELASLRNGTGSEVAAPTPGIGEIPQLVELMKEAGLAVTLRIDPGCADAAAVVGAAAYRIVQESLTNVARHAGTGAEARVTLVRRPAAIEVEVTNSVSPTAAGAGFSEGHGIAGMRERAAALGGTLAIDSSDSAVRVLARLPVASS